MFSFAILIGIYSYVIFSLGILGLLYTPVIIGLTIVCLFISLFSYYKFHYISLFSSQTKKKQKKDLVVLLQSTLNKKNIFISILFIFIGLQIFINLIGVLGPELSFDALWYHLTLPKIYLLQHRVSHIPGGLFYYSTMPKLGEMLYIGSLSFGSEIYAKVIHFIFGLLSCFALYKFSRMFFDRFISLLAIIIFYSNLVVGWESMTAYIDLIRTFFELLSLFAFIYWDKTKKDKWFIVSAIMLGLAITTKLIALGSIAIFLTLIVLQLHKNKREMITKIFMYAFLSFLIPLPWFLFSFIQTHNPFYPLFTSLYPTHFSRTLFYPPRMVSEFWKLFTHADDPISPVYIAFLPLVLIVYSKLRKEIKLVVVYSFLALCIWYLTPRTGGGRFIMPYFPAFSLLCAGVVDRYRKTFMEKILVFFILTISLISIEYRGIANAKYIPVILRHETKTEFLTRNLNFSFGDFYDADGYFASHIRSADRVLLIGFHNEYYVDFPFIDSSYVAANDCYDYIATQHADLPSSFINWHKIYYNSITGVTLYKKT